MLPDESQLLPRWVLIATPDFGDPKRRKRGESISSLPDAFALGLPETGFLFQIKFAGFPGLSYSFPDQPCNSLVFSRSLPGYPATYPFFYVPSPAHPDLLLQCC